MPLDEPPQRLRLFDPEKPPLIQQLRGHPPRLDRQEGVETLDHDEPMVRMDGERVWRRVLQGVREGRGLDDDSGGRSAQRLHECDVPGPVERPVRAAALVCKPGIGQRVELRTREVPPVEAYQDRRRRVARHGAVVDEAHEAVAERRFAGRGAAGDADDEARVGRRSAGRERAAWRCIGTGMTHWRSCATRAAASSVVILSMCGVTSPTDRSRTSTYVDYHRKQTTNRLIYGMGTATTCSY
ncbi:unnamed protein product [Mycena citricolor]|uniref:Uncharacterized protein n=1 Tax=Mycena citricolor TaxID=2018698 RepID=A0AAD2Q6I0_9AGAR|nr:unnamed protein product [Mycena citricolor]